MVLLNLAPEVDDKVISEEILIKLFPLFICNTFSAVSILIAMVKSHHESHAFLISAIIAISFPKAKTSDFIGRVIAPFTFTHFTDLVLIVNIVTSSVHVTHVETIHEADPIFIACIESVVEHLASEFSIVASATPEFTEVVVIIGVIISIIISTALIIIIKIVFTKVPGTNYVYSILHDSILICGIRRIHNMHSIELFILCHNVHFT